MSSCRLIRFRMQSRFPNIRPVVTEWLLFRSDQLRCLPYTEEDRRSAISDVLKAVSAFHATGHRDFHRDIRWPNVLKRLGARRFRACGQIRTAGPARRRRHRLSSARIGGRPYSFPGDIYCVGGLLDAWQHARGPAARSLRHFSGCSRLVRAPRCLRPRGSPDWSGAARWAWCLASNGTRRRLPLLSPAPGRREDLRRGDAPSLGKNGEDHGITLHTRRNITGNWHPRIISRESASAGWYTVDPMVYTKN